ncbi:MAG: hypothetical protein EKK39_08075 [Sphingobacteriales bacterium]|uniref:hypothetical protein n=1 Tax=Hydrotalea flava TaxID=714549 RepID=UPI0008357868|nr:hypothetical protein [Hydrotalea flava]RTL51554.1 MAG: hypothetical protein EKK39_08075 [Sphingobacteriales bacterium]
MKIKDLLSNEKTVTAIPFFKGNEGTATALKILQNHQLKKHITKVPTVLIYISGNAVFENEKGVKEILLPGEFIKIEPMVKYWVTAKDDSSFLLIK